MKNNKRVLYDLMLAVNVILISCYILWRAAFTLPVDKGAAYMIGAMIFLCAEIFGIIFLMIQLFLIRRSSKIGEAAQDLCNVCEYPETDIYILDRFGDKKKTENSINACLLADYPDKNKIHIIEVNGGSKELNEALAKSKSHLIAVIESGMLPKHDFLMETVKYFTEETEGKKTGFVQTACGYFNPDSYQFRLLSQQLVPNEKRYFYKCQQPVFDMDNSVICSGSGAVFLKKAIDDIGGFDEKCPLGYTATGIRILKKGYKSKYIEKSLMSGLFDSDISDNITQKRLLMADTLTAIRNERVIFSRGLSFRQKKDLIAYSTGLSNPIIGLVKIIIPLIYFLSGINLINADAKILAAFWIAIYFMLNMSLKKMSKNCISLKWKSIYESSMLPYLIMPRIKSFLGIYKPKYINKSKTNKFKNILYFIPHIILVVLDTATVLIFVKAFFYRVLKPLDIIFMIWLTANMYYEFMSVMWITGRPYVRQDDRVNAHINYEIQDSIQTICGVTRDLSPRGVSVWCDKPYDIDNDETVKISLDDGRYHVCVEGNVIGVERDTGHWKYIILFHNIEEQKQQYYGMLYDRMSIETVKLSAPQDVISDIRRNVGKRFKIKKLEYRRMVRIPVNKEIDTADGESIFVKNYNYKYLLIKSKDTPKEHITAVPVNGVTLECERIHKFGEHAYQYIVLNYNESRNDEAVREKLYEWTDQCYVESMLGLAQDTTGYADVTE